MTKLEKKTEIELFKQLVDERNCDDRKIWVSVESLKQILWSSKLSPEERLNLLQNKLEGNRK